MPVKFIPCSSFLNCFNANTENFENFPYNVCIFNEAKSCIFFCEFLKDFKFLENRNNIYESSSLKEFFRQSFKIFYVLNLASNSRHF